MKTYRFLLLLLLSGLGWQLAAQSTFSKRYTTGNTHLAISSFAQLPNGNFVSSAIPLNSDVHTDILSWKADGEPNWRYKYEVFSTNHGSVGIATNQANETAFVVQSYNGEEYIIVVKLDENGQKLWDVKLDSVFETATTNIGSANIINTIDNGYLVGYTVSHDWLTWPIVNGRVELCKLTNDGALVWAKKYERGGPEFLKNLVGLSNGNFLCSVQKDTMEESTLMAIDPNGELLWTKEYKDFLITGMEKFPNEDFLLAGSTSGLPVIARTDSEGNLIWAKGFNFPYSIIFGYPNNTFIYAKPTMDGRILGGGPNLGFLLDGNGTPEWIKSSIGYPYIVNNSEYVFIETIINPNDNFLSFIIKKTGPDAEVPGCESHRACLELEDITLDIVPGPTYTFTEMTFDTTVEGTLVPFDFFAEDYCEPDPEPSANFSAPPVVCAGDCFELSDLQQENAEYWNWSFSGLSPDESTVQNPNEICTMLPGNYELKQIIGYSGCLDSFSLMVEVQSNITPDLGPDVFECEGANFMLDATTPGATAYLWDDQTTNPIREVTAEGQYTVTVISGECEGSDAINIGFFETQYPAGSLELGSALTSCEGIPVAISPAVPQGLTYEWDDGVFGSNREFTTSGDYTLTGSFQECSLSETISVLFEDCESQVYLPTAFSPNGDGINDLFQAYGVNFQVESLKVFDRWGGLVYDGQGEGSHWDGYAEGKPVQPGVYVYLLEYTSIVLGQSRRASGEVTLVR